MTGERLRTMRGWLAVAAWLVLLALLPWWLGLPLLLAIAAILLVSAERLGSHAAMLRRGLRWGLAAALFALQRALGGDAFAWGAALLGGLAGYTLLAGLEAWLDRARRRAAAAPAHVVEWPQLAMAPVGPPAAIIELQPPHWHDARQGVADPRGGRVDFRAGTYRLADGFVLDGAGPMCGFGPGGDWFVAAQAQAGGLLLCDRMHGRIHRVCGWQLYGWQGAQPWLARDGHSAPLPLKEVLGLRGR
ncbi:hypothetical protein ASG87_08865 [Frateuria sp. Soil773]|uniref:hypothetical protein n=1 Tax=Frateuria sp. Soil773 TaxID=1736407 RepID=UPI0006FFB8D9|nr:hypothetical protein [Frateuria sp. Soil773]KRE88680.1 hypothetical protein ASG87_08865 [Frateuria sp. Soil773]